MLESVVFYVLMTILLLLMIANLLVMFFIASLVVKVSDKLKGLAEYLARIPIAEVTTAPKVPPQGLLDLMEQGTYDPRFLEQIAANQMLR